MLRAALKSRHIGNFGEEQHAFFALGNIDVIGRLDRERDGTLFDTVEIDCRFGGFVFLFVLLFFVVFLLVGILALVGVFSIGVFLVVALRGAFFFVALGFDRRFFSGFQHDRVDVAQNRVLIARKIEPACGEADVGARCED